MKNKKVKRILAGVQTAAVVATISVMASGCHKDHKSSCSSCSAKKTEMQKDKSSPGKGSCSK